MCITYTNLCYRKEIRITMGVGVCVSASSLQGQGEELFSVRGRDRGT